MHAGQELVDHLLLASAAGHGGEDDSAVVKVFPGVKLPGPAGRDGR